MSNLYWAKRFEKLELLIIEDVEKFINSQIKLYEDSTLLLEKEIENWYNRLCANDGVSYSTAKKKLTPKELKQFMLSIEEFIEKANNNINGEWTDVLNKASASSHITRLESLKYQVQVHIDSLYAQLHNTLGDKLAELYEYKTYNTAYAIQKGLNLGASFHKLNTNVVEKAIKSGWASDMGNYSSRIWKNKDLLMSVLNKDLVTSIILGESPNKVISKISKDLNVGKNNVSRLVRTESAYVSSLAGYDTLKELEVEEYEISACLDNRTSETCQNLDGQIFDIDEYDIGTTAPPFHPNCRSTTVPVISLFEGTRFARDKEGKGVYIDGNITYKEWAKEFLVD